MGKLKSSRYVSLNIMLYFGNNYLEIQCEQFNNG